MKRLLTKASKPRSNSAPLTPPLIHLSNPIEPHTTGLQPKSVVPAVPQPYPHTYLAIFVTKEGLLICPHVSESGTDQTEWFPCIRVSWGKSVKVEEIERYQLSEKLDWNESVIVYGIVGILELFSCSFLMLFLEFKPFLMRGCPLLGSYLLLITSRIKIGNGLFHRTYHEGSSLTHSWKFLIPCMWSMPPQALLIFLWSKTAPE